VERLQPAAPSPRDQGRLPSCRRAAGAGEDASGSREEAESGEQTSGSEDELCSDASEGEEPSGNRKRAANDAAGVEAAAAATKRPRLEGEDGFMRLDDMEAFVQQAERRAAAGSDGEPSGSFSRLAPPPPPPPPHPPPPPPFPRSSHLFLESSFYLFHRCYTFLRTSKLSACACLAPILLE